MPRHLMLVPSLACPARCAYCFGQRAEGSTMSHATLEAVVAWQRALLAEGEGASDGSTDGANDSSSGGTTNGSVDGAGVGETLEITFHGGEPLVPGVQWYRTALPLLRDGLSRCAVRFAVQTNLWLLTDELCELFAEYRVSLGTSLDGPEEINDAQRGAGCFARTMAGIDLARRHGLDVGVICTFTSKSAPRSNEIFDFFVARGLSFSVHAALPSLHGGDADCWSLDVDEHARVLAGLLERYLAAPAAIRIGTLDSIARSISAGRGGICAFGDCLGDYLAVGPDGAIYPCQRFAGMAEFAVGDVTRRPGPAELRRSPAWQLFAERERRIGDVCGDCAYLAVCRGGCPYATLAFGKGMRTPSGRDPQCEAYRRTFELITERALSEVFSPRNLEAVVGRPDSSRGLLRRGPLLSLMNGTRSPGDGAMAPPEPVS